VLHDLLLVLGSNILIVNRLARFGVDPSNVSLSVLELSVKVFDVSHHPRHLDTAFNGELASRFHLPTSSRAAPGADFGEASNNDNLVEVD
jgi:hypothetical protein